MFKGEKTLVFWIGLVIFGLAVTGLIIILWYPLVLPSIYVLGGFDYFKYTMPWLIGCIIFILIGLYMMKSGTKKI